MNSIYKKYRRGFSLPEVMIAGTIVTLTIGCTMSAFLFGMRTMYKDSQRLQTNAILRTFLANVTKYSLDSTEFYLFPNYTSFNGSIDVTSATPNTSALAADSYDTYFARGDCLALISRVATVSTSNVRRIRIYYRVTTASDTPGPIRFYEIDYGTAGSSTAIQTLLNAINLAANPSLAGSKQVVEKAIGRKINNTTTYYPIFSTESETPTPTNESVAVNVEVINGTSANNMLSSSSFNYIISPRK